MKTVTKHIWLVALVVLTARLSAQTDTFKLCHDIFRTKTGITAHGKESLKPLMSANSTAECDLEPPYGLTASVINSNTVYLQWQPPESGDWLQWDDGNNFSGIGLASGSTFSVAARWLPSHITPYEGKYLREVAFFPCEDEPGITYTVKIWKGENASTLLYSTLITELTADTWNTHMLEPPVQIDASQELWVGYEVYETDGTYPAGIDYGPAITGFGDKVNFNGSWENLSDYGLSYNWNLKAYVSDPEKGTEVLLGYNAYTKTDSQSDYEKINAAIIPNTSYSCMFFPPSHPYFRYFYVTAVYDVCESDPSNIVYTDVSSVNNPDSPENLNVYPVPADDYLNVTADEVIQEIEILNYQGKTVLHALADAQHLQIDISALTAGMYLIRVETKHSSTEKRFVIK